jgi:copper transport protein
MLTWQEGQVVSLHNKQDYSSKIISGTVFAALLIAGMALLPQTAGAGSGFGPGTALHAHGEGGDTAYWLKESAVYALRALYYGMLLVTTGHMLTFLAVSPGERGARQREWMGKWSGPMAKTLLLVVLLHVFVQSNRVASGLQGGFDDWLRVFTMTSSGQAWLVMVGLAVFGLIAARLPDAIKAVWALLLIATESLIGHPAASDELTVAVLSDFIHLACSSMWVSGVVLLLLFWRYDRKEAGRFAETFSGIAWLMIAILVVTGAIMAWLLLPDLSALWRGAWGRWLMGKTAVVLLVIGIGAALRRSARRGELPRGSLLKLDGILMGALLIIVAVFTAISPAPASHPVNYHRMGNDLHYTLKIEPNAPGPNDVELQIWLPEDKGEPASIGMVIIPQKKPSAAVNIELESRPPGIDIPFPGYNEFRFVAKKTELSGAGNWKARFTVRLGDGTELEREFDFKLGY